MLGYISLAASNDDHIEDLFIDEVSRMEDVLPLISTFKFYLYVQCLLDHKHIPLHWLYDVVLAFGY